MKLYYAMLLMVQLLISTVESDKKKRAYFMYLWSNLMAITPLNPGVTGQRHSMVTPAQRSLPENQQ